TGQRPGLAGVEALDARIRVGAAQALAPDHSRQQDVGRIQRGAGNLFDALDARRPRPYNRSGHGLRVRDRASPDRVEKRAETSLDKDRSEGYVGGILRHRTGTFQRRLYEAQY